jgi:hypothetical protein
MAPKEVFKLYTAALDRGDLKAMAALIHDNFRLEGAGLDGIGKPEFLGAMKAQLEAFPDYSENPTDMTEDGDVVRFVAHVRGTQRGTLALCRGWRRSHRPASRSSCRRSRLGSRSVTVSCWCIKWRRSREAASAGS